MGMGLGTLGSRFGRLGNAPSKGVGVWGNYGRGPNNGFGLEVMDWSDFGSLQNSAGTAALVTDDVPSGSTKALKLTNNATASFGQVQLSPYYDLDAPSSLRSWGVWVKNPQTKAMGIRFDFYNSTAAKTYVNRVVVDPGTWQFIVFPHVNTAVTGGAWSGGTLGGDSIRFVRATQDNPSGTPVWASGDYMLIGPVRIGPQARPKFMLGTDDGFDDNIDVGGFRDIAESYGFKLTIYIVPPLVGTAGYLTWPQIADLRDAGHCIASHSWSHPVASDSPATSFLGMTRLGPQGFANVPAVSGATNDDTAIYDDLVAARDDMLARGYPDAVHLALPQGGFDEYVRTAAVRAGFKTVRGVSGTGLFGFPIPVGKNAHGTQNAGVPLQSGWLNLGGSVQYDGVATEAQILAYVDECIRIGASGTAYGHTNASSAFTKFDALCAYLKTKSDADLIDVVTVAQWHDGLRAPALP
jgi:peptidoglycan/xylan/chitin deacetylase (PgdA/CDA1 family)